MAGKPGNLLQEKIGILRGIDTVRDRNTDPDMIFSESVKFLRKALVLDYVSIIAKHPKEKTYSDKGASYSSAVRDPLFADMLKVSAVQIRRTAVYKNRVLHIIQVPIKMNGELLGNIIAGSLSGPISSRTAELLKTAESQIDSGIIQAYRMKDLSNREKELETIYRIDRIRDRHYVFEEMLHKVINEVKKLVHADSAFIMLYNKRTEKLDMTDYISRKRFTNEIHMQSLRLGEQTLIKEKMLTKYSNDAGISYMGIPLILQDEIIGVLGCINFSDSGFTDVQKNFLRAIASQTDTAIFESMEKRKLKQVLGRAVDPKVMRRILENADTGFLKGERMLISVLYADIRGSTSLAESTDPELLVSFINDYLETMTGIIFANEGTVDKYVGDEVMALFGAPFRQDDHAQRAVKTGLEMQAAYKKLVEKWVKEKGIQSTALGVGIATGELIAGEMGGSRRTDYTVIGRTANLGARICNFAKADEVLICSRTRDMALNAVIDKEMETEFKGIGKAVRIFNVTGIRP